MDGLGDRMKGYESVFDPTLPQRLPLIVRVDGKAFHTLTKKCEKPWDKRVEDAMDSAAFQLCQQIQGAKLAYIQSDEISVLVNNYQSLDSDPWFGNRLQKMVSISASIASVAFTQAFGRVGFFDSRIFVLPEADINNYFLWRQRDAERNSVQLLARSLASHKECHGKNNSELQELSFQRGINWNDLPTARKRGRCVVREPYYGLQNVVRHRWVVDTEIPRFGADKDYTESNFRSVDVDDQVSV